MVVAVDEARHRDAIGTALDRQVRIKRHEFARRGNLRDATVLDANRRVLGDLGPSSGIDAADDRLGADEKGLVPAHGHRR